MPIPKGNVQIERVSVRDRVYEDLKKWIIDGTLVPEEKISDIEIASLFNVSRTPVREAFLILENQKLIKTYPGKGTIVTSLEKDNITKMYYPLASLQCLAARLACESISQKGMDRLKSINEKYKKCLDDGNVMDLLHTDRELHDLILEAAGNEYIVDFCDTLVTHVMRYEYIYLSKRTFESRESSIQEHDGLVNAICERNGDKAAAYMAQNWLRPAKEIQEHYMD